MKPTILDLVTAAPEMREAAAGILKSAFAGTGTREWRTDEECRAEVAACAVPEYICLGALLEGALAGWIGLRPAYGRYTWELHPLAADPRFQGRGVGRALVEAAEERCYAGGGRGVMLGTDDEAARTSLSAYDHAHDDLFDALRSIRNLKNHPYGFYSRLGYRIIGAVPDANGPGKPDILMWKALRA